MNGAGGRAFIRPLPPRRPQRGARRILPAGLAGELDLYDRSKIAEQDARGALSLAERHGREEGRAEGLREAVRVLCQAFEIEIDAEREAFLAGMGAGELKELQARLLRDRRWS